MTVAEAAGFLGEGHRYRLDDRIATGGMGEVWRATDTVLGRVVAVKVLKNEYADDPLFRSRFEAEARNAAALHHPGVASVFDFGGVHGTVDSPLGRPFLVMELVPGQPLSGLLQAGKPMPPATAADLMAQAADAIAVAHAQHIVHRDVKPANMMVTPEGRVKITDFGIARAADSLALTKTGEVVGTPHYLSPEQAEGKPATAVSDIYALGVVLFECLSGRRPFVADTPVAVALAHLRAPVPELPDTVPEHLRQITMRALAKSPGDRFASAAEMAAALRGADLPSGAGVAATVAVGARVGEPEQTRVLTGAAPQRRRRGGDWPIAAAVAAVLLVVALAFALGGGGNEDTTAADDPKPQVSKDSRPRDERIRVGEPALVGMEVSRAEDELEALGFERVREEKTDNPGGNVEGTVASVTPHGLVKPGSEITLFAWDKAPDAQQSEGDDDSDDEVIESPEESVETGQDKGKGSQGKGSQGKGSQGKAPKGKK